MKADGDARRARVTRRRAVCGAAAGLLMALALGVAGAEEIDPQCLVSYDVGERVMEVPGMTVSCQRIEAIRHGVLDTLLRLEGSTGNSEAAARLGDLKERAGSATKQAWWEAGDLAVSFLGNLTAMIGLVTCTGTTGGLCLVAIAGVVTAKYSMVRDSADVGEAIGAAQALRAELDATQRAIEADAANIERKRKSLVREFNGFCAQVRAQCL